MTTKARQLAEFIANADVDSDEIATGAVSASKLAATLDLSSKTIVMPDLSGTLVVDGGYTNNDDSAAVFKGTGSEHIKLLLDTSSTGGHRASVALESNSNEVNIATTGSNEMRFSTATTSDAMFIKNDGYIGIGTANPVAGLDVANGAGYFTSFNNPSGTRSGLEIGWDGSKSVLQSYDRGNNTFEQILYNASSHYFANGSIGIGVSAPESKLAVKGSSGDADLFSISDIGVPTSGSEYGVAMIKTNSTEFALNITGYNAASKGLRLYTNGGASARTALQVLDASGTNLIVNGSGNVGIGTASPQLGSSWNKVLHVHSPDGVGSHIRFTDTTSGETGESGLYIGQYGNDAYLINRESGFIALRVNGSNDAIRITSSSFVGLNNNNPQSSLAVYHSAASAYSSTADSTSNMSGIRVTASPNQNVMTGIWFGTGGDQTGSHWTGIAGSRTNYTSDWGTRLSFYTHPTATNSASETYERMTIDPAGRVGIGTNSPQTPLHIQTNTAGIVTELRLKNLQNNRESRLSFYDENNNNQMHLQYDNGGNRSILTTNGNGLTIYSNQTSSEIVRFGLPGGSNYNDVDFKGKVGIGTPTPSEKLHVYGSGQQFIKVETTTTGSAAFVGMRMQDGDGDLGSIGDFGSGRRAFMLDTGSGVDMMFFTNNQNNSSDTPRLTITSGGNVAIATTPTTTSGSLHVGGSNGGLSVGAGNHAGYHIFSQHEGNIPANTTRDVLQFEGPMFARYLKVTVSGYLCQKEVYFYGYQGWNGASNGNNVGSTVNGIQTFGNGTNSGITVQLECTATTGTAGIPRYKLKIVTGGLSGQLYDTTVVAEFFNPVFYPSYL